MPKAPSRKEQNPKEQQNYIMGAAYLTAAIAAVKIIGALYKIPIQNMFTEEGNSQYFAAYQIYATLFTVATAGLPVAISKMVSESIVKKNGETGKILIVAQRICLAIGILGSLFMFFGANSIANLMHAPGAVWAIRAIAPSVFFVGFICPYRGYFQGHGNMKPSAISEVIEALGKLIFGVGLAYIVLTKIFPADGTERTQVLRDNFGAAAAIAGVAIGMMFSAIYLSIKGAKEKKVPALPQSRKLNYITAQMLSWAFPVMLSSSVLSITNLIDNGMVRNLLVSHAGFTEMQMDKYVGSYSLSVTLFNLPAAFVATLGTSLLPAITAFRTANDERGIKTILNSSMRVTSLLAMPAAAGFFVLSEPILSVLYSTKIKTGGVAIAAPLLQVLGLAVAFSAIVTVTNSILQAINHKWFPIKAMAVGCVCKIVCTLVLVANPAIHINGGPIGTLVCYGVITVMNLWKITKETKTKLALQTICPLLSAIIMGIIVFGIYQAFLHFTHSITISCLGAICCGAISYFSLVLMLHGVARSDLEMLRGGKKLADFLNIK